MSISQAVFWVVTGHSAADRIWLDAVIEEAMPYKANADRRHKIPKACYRVTNWPEYDTAVYSHVAIETRLALRLVFHQPLRQTEGAMRSIVVLLGVDLAIPDHTTFSRRSGELKVLPQRVARNEPLRLLVASTGVKIYGEGEWSIGNTGIRSRLR
jgi:hypothetical protein